MKALEFLRQKGFKQVKSVKGGIYAWSDPIDHGVARYWRVPIGIGRITSSWPVGAGSRGSCGRQSVAEPSSKGTDCH